ncbi:MAG: DNA polymerase III subunit alpha [SAR324 cluster bacterium]|nr:DNA polymerase III subunit alpha [SAR324 cluster bacterium]
MFNHLHVHSQYSLMEGAIRIKALAKVLKEKEFSACAITDHGNMFGVVEFYQALKKEKIKPIIGLGTFVTEGLITDPRENGKDTNVYQTLLLCADRQGYQNLTYIASRAFTEGKHWGVPRTDHAMLEEYRHGLIALSGGMDGELSKRLLAGKNEEALQIAGWYRDVFEGRYYIEIQNTGIPEQNEINVQLMEIARKLGIPLVGTNDCYYLKQSESDAQYILELMRLQKRVTDRDIPPKYPDQRYLKSKEEMLETLAGFPEEVLSNTVLIAEQCELSLDNKQYFLPKFEIPQDYTPDEWFIKASWEGLEFRLKHLYDLYHPKEPFEEFRKPYDARLKFELDVIISMKFPGYFLIVADFINWSKDNGVPVGPGRGSGAGSVVAYALRITDVDPLKYGLLFERFLNPDRVSMPDFDVDFEVKGREKVIDYVKHKYGENNVCQIATFQSLKAKAVVRNVARVLDFPYSEADKIAKLVPNDLNITLEEALQKEPELAKLEQEGTDNEKQLIAYCRVLEGLNTHLGTHAAGVIIMDQDIRKVMPVCTSKEDALQSMYTMKYAEDQGAVKFDFLGLLNLSIIDETIKLINAQFPEEDRVDIEKINMEDPLTFDLFCNGETTGIFQLESSGMKRLLADMQPTLFEDIVAILALYRPGPLGSGMVEDFVQCKHGKKEVIYPHPLLKNILKETYGVMVYQEQIMQAVQVLAGFSLGQADLLRRAIGKKIPEILREQREKFVEGCLKNPEYMTQCPPHVGPADKANEIFDLIDYFSGYGFNKSHTVAYGLISYQTAYLKAHFPVQFMAALLNCSINNPDKIVTFISDCKEMGIQVLPPDVNSSLKEFTVSPLGYKVTDRTLQYLKDYEFPSALREHVRNLKGILYETEKSFIESLSPLEKFGPKPEHYLRTLLREARWEAVRFGLNAVKNVGANAVDAIIDVRESRSDKRLNDFMEFIRAVDFKRINRRMLETLIKCGAFDSLHSNRAQLFESLEEAVHLGQEFQREADPYQNSLFDLLSAEDVKNTETPLVFKDIRDWPNKERLRLEKEALGFYVSGHPLDNYMSEVQQLTRTTQDLREKEVKEGEQIALAGVVVSKTIRLNKQLQKFAIVKIEDLKGSLEFPVYYQLFENSGQLLDSDEPLLITGRVVYRGEDEVSIMSESLQLLSDYRLEKAKSMTIETGRTLIPEQNLKYVRGEFMKFPGTHPIYFKFRSPDDVDVTIQIQEKVNYTPMLVERLAEMLKDQNIYFRY